MLGDRLASSENPALKKQSQICYICSGNLNKLIEVSNAKIQEIVELVVIMQKALELQGIKEIQIEDKIATVLSQYAEMLATEGNLEAALNYLGNSQEQRISMLRDRLCRALGYIQDQKYVTKPAVQNYYEQTRRSSQNIQNVYNPLQQPLQQPTSTQNWNTTPLKQSYGTSTNQFNIQPSQPYGMSQSQVQSTMHDQYSTSQMYNQISATQQPPLPPPPTSASSLSGSRPSSVGPQSRSKYLIDPSVKSTPSYNQSGFPQQNQFYNPQQIAPVPAYPIQHSSQSQMLGNTYPNQSSNLMTNPKEPELYKPPQSNVIPPFQNPVQTQMYEPIKTQPPPLQTQYGVENTFPSQPSGWNDPPIGKSSRIQVNLHFLFI